MRRKKPSIRAHHLKSVALQEYALPMCYNRCNYFLFPTTTSVVTESMDTAHRLILGPQSESTGFLERWSLMHWPIAGECHHSGQTQLSPCVSVGLPTFPLHLSLSVVMYYLIAAIIISEIQSSN